MKQGDEPEDMWRCKFKRDPEKVSPKMWYLSKDLKEVRK